MGGQAVVAYGVTQFTRDLDIWIKPTLKNLNRLKRAITELDAVQCFLPPLDLKYLRAGHGAHFIFNHLSHRFQIDIMSHPPRVRDYSAAFKAARLIDWHGLKVPILDIQRLVATKKTLRDKDYLIIQGLVNLVYFHASHDKALKIASIPWLLKESRDPKQLKLIIAKWPGAKRVARKIKREATRLALELASDGEVEMALHRELQELKLADRRYWKPILADLRRLRKK